jgi:hypothetical protein
MVPFEKNEIISLHPTLSPIGRGWGEEKFDEVRKARMINLFVTETLGLKKVA